MEACVGAEGICVLTEVSRGSLSILRARVTSSSPDVLTLPVSFVLPPLKVGRVQGVGLAINLRKHVEAGHGVRRSRHPRL